MVKANPVRRRFRSACACVVAGVVLACGSSGASAQSGVESRVGGSSASVEELVANFNHFVLIARADLAEANARAILARGLSGREFLGLVEDAGMVERFDEAYRRALRVESLEGVAAELRALYESGRRERARDPREIDRNIELLSQGLRARLLARERLLEAREYAVPQLLEVLLGGDGVSVRAEARSILQELGLSAARPLSAALLGLDETSQQVVASVLGTIGHREAVASLLELREGTANGAVRSAASAALEEITGAPAGVAGSVSEAYRALGESYYADRNTMAMASFPGERHQLLWEYFPGIGLEPTAIYSELYHEARVMGAARRALELDPTDRVALSLWLTANFSREAEQPAGYDNPAYPAERRGAMYYAVASGPTAVQRVLARCLADRETRLALRAIEALTRSVGGSGLWGGLGGERPLVEALSYPDRRVQYEAALALASALPESSFPGVERVVPTVAALVRDAGRRYALVIGEDASRRQAVRSALEGAGFEVVAPSSSLEGAEGSIADVPGVDMIVVEAEGASALEMVRSIRGSSRLAVTPVLALMTTEEVLRARALVSDDHLTRLASRGLTAEQLGESVRQLSERASGEAITDAEARAYAARALEALRAVAISGSTVLSVEDASSALIGALEGASGESVVGVAEVVAHVGTSRAQGALADAALGASGGARVALLEATSASVKRFGNLLADRQVSGVVRLSESGDERVTTAAAALVGSLDLPTDRVVPLIIGAE